MSNFAELQDRLKARFSSTRKPCDRMQYLSDKKVERSECWSPPGLTKEEKEAQEKYIELHGCKF